MPVADPPAGLLLAAAVLALPAGPPLARTAARLAARDPGARAPTVRVAVTTALLAVLWPGAVALTGARPATVALLWAAGAGVVLAAVDLAVHRLPDRVTYPATAVALTAFALDACLLGSWTALLRALLAGLAAAALALAAAAASPQGLGLGDVKLLGLLGLVLGWAGWGVLAAGVLFGLVAGALLSVGLVLTRRAGWRSAVPFGPPLLAGAVLALAVCLAGSADPL